MSELQNHQLKQAPREISAQLLWSRPSAVILIKFPPSAKLFCCKTVCLALTVSEDKREKSSTFSHTF